MKAKGKIGRWIILLLALVCVVQAAAAFDVTKTEINPASGDLEPGQQVTAHYVISYSMDTSSDDEAFEFSTGLRNPAWTFIVYRDEIPIYTTEKTGYYPKLGAFELAYKDKVELDVQLRGTVPPTANGELEIFKLEHTRNKNVVDNYRTTRNVVSAGQVESSLSVQQQHLKELKADIDKMAADGVDVSAVQEKYSAASKALTSAASAGPSKAAEYIATATKNMDEARALLDRAWAEKEVGDTATALETLDDMITYFVEDRSMSSDPRVVTLVTKRESAVQFYSQAKDALNAQNYPLARSKATDGLNKANEALAEANALREEIGEGLDLGDILLYAGIGVVVLLIIAGVVIYRKKTRWDELG
jgi:hypothetical protein